MASLIGQTVSHYKILERLGAGGMGEVYKAEDRKLKRTVALKFLPPSLTSDPDAKERFIHEAQAASALDHPNICNIHEIGETHGEQLFIAMACYEGDTLKKKIEVGPLPIDQVVDITLQVAGGLSRAHEAGIIHRDIKPANLMVTDRGEVKILDFGLAKLSGRTLLTKTGTTLGTAAYMSPEQARSESVDDRTDIWSLGVVLYEMLTGKRPFESSYEQALVYSILNEEPKAVRSIRPEVPEALEKITRRSMAKDSKDRYQAVAELIADLESYRGGTQLSQKTQRVRSRKLSLAHAALAGIVIAIAAFGIYYFTAGKGEVFDHIAVLPFRNLSGDDKLEWLADAMTEEVTSRLQEVAALRVPSSRGVMKYKNSQESYRELAEIMHANALVDPSMLVAAGGHVRVRVKLIDPSSDRVLWQSTFDGAREDILDLQSKIAQAVVREVRVNVSQGERRRLGRSQKRVNPQAFELSLQAYQDAGRLYSEPSKARFESIMANLQKAIEIEPDNAYYYCVVQYAYGCAISNFLVSGVEALPKMRTAAETAMKLDPDLVESQLAAANVAFVERDFERGLPYLTRAFELNQGRYDIRQFRGLVLTLIGRFDEALVMIDGLQELDPIEFKEGGWKVGDILFYMRRYDDAISFLQGWLLGNPQAESARWHLAMALSMKGLHAEALAQCDSMTLSGPMSRPILLAKAGDRALAMKAFRQVSSIEPYSAARFYACLMERDSAFNWLHRAYQEYSTEVLCIRVDPLVDNLRQDPRFGEFLKPLNPSH